MSKYSLTVFFIILIFSFSSSAYANKYTDDEFIAGKIDFIDRSGKEGIVTLLSPEKAYLLNKGELLIIRRGGKTVILKITDNEGKYLRCVITGENSADLMEYGETAYYSDTVNSSIKYRDASRILSGLIRLYEDFILKIESTEDPAVITAAVNRFAAELDMLIPEMKRINGKYPELEKFSSAPPAELLNESARLGVLEPRLKDAFFKINMFSADGDVKKAIDNLQAVLTKMNTGK